jgi:hypothetical protein
VAPAGVYPATGYGNARQAQVQSRRVKARVGSSPQEGFACIDVALVESAIRLGQKDGIGCGEAQRQSR